MRTWGVYVYSGPARRYDPRRLPPQSDRAYVVHDGHGWVYMKPGPARRRNPWDAVVQPVADGIADGFAWLFERPWLATVLIILAVWTPVVLATLSH